MDTLLVIERFKDMALDNRDMSFGELVYSVFREKNSKLPFNDVAFVCRAMENNEWYTIIERAIEKEEK